MPPASWEEIIQAQQQHTKGIQTLDLTYRITITPGIVTTPSSPPQALSVRYRMKGKRFREDAGYVNAREPQIYEETALAAGQDFSDLLGRLGQVVAQAETGKATP